MQIKALVSAKALNELAPGDLFRCIGRGPKRLDRGAQIILDGPLDPANSAAQVLDKIREHRTSALETAEHLKGGPNAEEREMIERAKREGVDF